MEDVGDAVDLQIRLQSLREEGRRVAFLIGSGPVGALVGTTQDLVELFRSAMPEAGKKRFADNIDPLVGTALAYQNAASLLKRQSGDGALSRVIRRAVLRCCREVADDDLSATANDKDHCRQLVETGDWDLPAGYEALASYYAGLNGRQRGPVLTTNFDPLLEVSLRRKGLNPQAYPVPYDSAPTTQQLAESPGIPVLHLHGYWTSSTLSTIAQLTKDRPSVHGLLRHILLDTTLVVLGYGGWEDAFMRSLEERAIGQDLELLNSEILWGAFADEPGELFSNPVLARLQGTPLFNLYAGVDANTLFDSRVEVKYLDVPVGYTLVYDGMYSASPDAQDFVDGGQPTWAGAFGPEAWPLLSGGEEMLERVRGAILAGGGSAVAGIGPMGEGKTAALKRVAAILSQDHWVLYRELGSPRITAEWLNENVHPEKHTVLVIDDADLVANDLIATLAVWAEPMSGITLVLSAHDRLWRRSAASLEHRTEVVHFQGVTEEDATLIAAAWERFGLLPAGAQSADEAAAALRSSSSAMRRTGSATLFGAVLDVQVGAALVDRVRDLLGRLSQVRVASNSPTSLGRVFAAICLLQDAFDPMGDKQRGASREVIAAMLGLDGVFADGRVLQLLGKEAALSFAGNRIYSRHPSIARAVVAMLRESGDLKTVAGEIGRAGGSLRAGSGVEWELYESAYSLGRQLGGDVGLAAAVGAIEGAGAGMLEPRVTALAIRRTESPEKAFEYARGIAEGLHAYADFGFSIRGFLNEFSLASRLVGQAFLASGLSAVSLADGVGYGLEARKAEYCLTSLSKSLLVLNRNPVGSSVSIQLAFLSYVALETIAGSGKARRLVPEMTVASADIELARSRSPRQLVNILCAGLKSARDAALADVVWGRDFPDAYKLEDLYRLLEIAHRQP